MTFPTIPTTAAGRILGTIQADVVTTRTFPNLSSLTKNDGDLLIAIIIAYQSSVNSNAFSGWTGGFTEFLDTSTTSTMAVGAAYKVSDGTETGTFAVTQAATITGHAAMIIMSIPGTDVLTSPEGGSRQVGTGAAANPAAFNPAGWDVEDTLWIAVGGSGETSITGSFTGVTAAPTDFTNYFDTGISQDVVGGTEGAVAFRQNAVASEDVAGFTVDTSNARNVAMVIAVRPVAGTFAVIEADAALSVVSTVGVDQMVVHNVEAKVGISLHTGAPFVTSVDNTGLFFADQNDDPILICGYVIWGLLMNAGRWGGTWQANLEAAVDGLAAMGVNAIYTEPLGNTQNGGAFNNGNTWDGVAPFTGGNPATFNNTFWERSDYLFSLCEAAGITVFFNVAYSDDMENAALTGFTVGQYTSYGTSLAARYKSRSNLVWMIGGDYFDNFNSRITAMKAAIRAEGDTHLFGVQNYPETTSRKDIENNANNSTGIDNADFNFVYSYNTTYWGMEYAYAEAAPITVLWGDGHFDQDSAPDRKVMRDLTWWAFTSGARGNILGSEGTWAWNSGGLANLTTDTFPNTDQPVIWDTFTSLDGWHLLRPDTDSSFVTAGRGTKSDYVTSSGGGGGEYNSSDTPSPYVTAGVTADGTLAVVYCPVSTTVTIDDTELVASYTVRWVDPADGTSTPETIAATYATPGANSLGGNDWLLVFEGA